MDIVSIQLDRSCGEPLYVQLYMALKGMIESGRLADNERLPPIRRISGELNINSSTVVNAYNLLESSGYAYSRVGSGTYVMSKGKSTGHDGAGSTGKSGDPPYKDLKNNISMIDFTSSASDPSLFPVEDFKKLMDTVLDRDGGQAFGYTNVKGYMPLRESIARYMKYTGVESSNDDIFVISGAQQGIDIISKVLIDYGDIIITEKPTYTGAIAVFKSRGARIVDIPIDERGIDIDGLEDTLKAIKPRFIYMMSNFQNPTGFSYDYETMERLLALAEEHNFYIIEDDYLSELYYCDRKPITLKSMDRHGRVIFIKSFSKTFMPGARLGFLIVPERLQHRVLSVKHFSDISSSGFMQRVFDLFIRSSLFEKYISDIKREYQKRYAAATLCIDKIPGISYYKPMGGIHLWIRLPDNMSSNMVYSECLFNNLQVSPGCVFFPDSMDSQYIRISYASLNVADVIRGTDILSSVIKRIQDNYLNINKALVL